jgi:hypothetical protein
VSELTPDPSPAEGGKPVAGEDQPQAPARRKRAKAAKVGATVDTKAGGVMVRHPDGTVATTGRVVTFTAPGRHAIIVAGQETAYDVVGD